MADASILRILDANLNRAREAARVLEEYARFALSDASLSAAWKELRHAIAAAVSEELGELRAAARNVEADVGREIGTEAEYRRAGVEEVAVAAAARLSEALRVIEEYGKSVDVGMARLVEQLRYRGYEIERRQRLHTRAVDRLGRLKLYVILTEQLCRRGWQETAEAALRGGADAIQLREKALSDRTLLRRARWLAGLCREHGVLCLVNDRPDVALLARADGVHVGQEDSLPAEVRQVFVTGLVGVSTHNLEQICDAIRAAPDYIAVGPMFPTATKPQQQIPGPSLLTTAAERTSLPLVAIGGISEQNVSQVLAAARCCVCVCSAVIAATDPEAAARRLRQVIDGWADPTPARLPQHEGAPSV